MSKIKALIESTDPSFQCSTKIEMTATDIMLSAEWDMTYERLTDADKAELLGVNQEVGNANSAFPNQQQEPSLAHPTHYRSTE